MLEPMWRLQPRGAANRGVAVDADGAMLGPDCVLVERAASGYRAARREPVRDMQRILGLDKDDPNWLYQQSQRIADALDRGEVALAQIYGLRIPVRDLDSRQLKQLGALAPLAKADFNPDEPRIPAGQPGGGEWTTGGGTGAAGADFTLDALNAGDDGGGNQDAAPAIAWHLRAPSSGSPDEDASAAEAETALESSVDYAEEPPASPSAHLVGGRWPAPTAKPLLHPAQAEEDENSRRGGLLGELIDPLREVRQERYEWLRRQLEDLEPGNPALQTLTGPDYPPTWMDINELDAALRDAQERAAEPPATTWELGWGARGIEFERQHLAGDQRLPPNTRTIDGFPNGVALSIKSIDLNAPWYGNPANLSRLIDRYVDKLVSFESLNWGGVRIAPNEIRGRVLDIIVPKNSGTAAQQEVIARSVERAQRLGVRILISRY